MRLRISMLVLYQVKILRCFLYTSFHFEECFIVFYLRCIDWCFILWAIHIYISLSDWIFVWESLQLIDRSLIALTLISCRKRFYTEMSVLKPLYVLIEWFRFWELLHFCLTNFLALNTGDEFLFFCRRVKSKNLDIAFLTSWTGFIWDYRREERRFRHQTWPVLFHFFRFIFLSREISSLVYFIEIHRFIVFWAFSTLFWIELDNRSVLSLILIFNSFAQFL